MPARSEPLLRHIRRLVSRPSEDRVSDAALLDRFVHSNDNDAFATLMERHGPMVFGVCRRVLHNAHEAEDAAQATFLILARNAARIRQGQTLVAWLHQTAHHLALKCLRTDIRRRKRELRGVCAAPTSPRPDPLDELSAREWLAILDEELRRLPERYRLPLLLCYLEGRTHEEAARQLGWTAGSVKGRLRRGLAKLHGRLVKRGLALSAIPLALAAVQAAPMPAGFLSATLRAAASRAGAWPTDHVPAREVMTLAEEGMRSLAATKAKAMATLLVAAGLTAAAGTLAHEMFAARPPEAQQAAQANPEANQAGPPKEKPRRRTDRYGDPLPPGALARISTVRFRHGEAVRSVAFAPDGKTLASASVDGTVRRWDAATGKELWRYQQSFAWQNICVRYSRDGKMLAAGHNGAIRLWDVATGRQLRLFNGGQFALSLDGKILAAADGEHKIRFYDTSTGQESRYPFTGHEAKISSLLYSADGKTLFSCSQDKTVRIWDAVTGKERDILRGHSAAVRALALSPDGKVVASGGEDKTIRLWDVAKGKELRRLELPDQVTAVTFAHDGKTLAAGGYDETIQLWDTDGARKPRRRIRLRSCIYSLAFAPDDRILASADQNMTVRLWNAATGEEVRRSEELTSQIYSLAISPDGGTVALAAFDEAIRLCDATTGKQLRRLQLDPDVGSSFSVAFSPDGKTLSSAGLGSAGNKVVGKGFDLWDVATGKRRQLASGQVVIRVAFSPDGKTVATGSDPIILSDTASGKEVRRIADYNDNVDALSFSPDGKLLASLCRNKTLIWNAATGQEVRRLPGTADLFGSLAFSPDSKLLATTSGHREEGGRVHLWDIATSKELRRLRRPLGTFSSVAFSPDGRSVATGDSVLRSDGDRQYREFTVHLWETSTGQMRREWKGHQAQIWALAFTPDGKRLISGSFDTTALIWDVRGHAPSPHAPTAAELNGWWSALAGADGSAAYQAICCLVAAPEPSLHLLKSRLKPVVAADTQQIARLITDLDADTFEAREKAAAALENQGEAAEPALRKALASRPSAEIRRRIERLLEALEQVHASERLRQSRALEVLEQLGNRQARELLQALAAGAQDVLLTREAKAALERLARRSPAMP